MPRTWKMEESSLAGGRVHRDCTFQVPVCANFIIGHMHALNTSCNTGHAVSRSPKPVGARGGMAGGGLELYCG